MHEIKNLIAALGKGDKAVEFKMPEQTGPKITQVMIDKWDQAVSNTIKLVDITDKHDLQVTKNTTYVSEIQRKLGDFALKEDLLQAQKDIKNLQGLFPLYEQHEKDIEWLKDEIAKLKKLCEKFASNDELNLLKQRVEVLEKAMVDLKKMVNTLQNKINGLKIEGGGGVDPDLLAGLQADIDNLRREFEEHKNLALNNLNELNVTMPTKADKSDLLDLDRKFKERLNECIR